MLRTIMRSAGVIAWMPQALEQRRGDSGPGAGGRIASAGGRRTVGDDRVQRADAAPSRAVMRAAA